MTGKFPVRLLRILAVLLALSVGPAYAGFEDGEAAFARKDWQAALDAWLPLAEQGDARAQYGLGTLYYTVQRNFTDGVFWYRKAAAQGDVHAQTRLGLILMQGKQSRGQTVVPQDRVAAIDWLRKAAGKGFAAAQYYLGFAHANGWGVERDEVEAVRWYRKSADQGFALAEYRMGEAYLTGKGAPTIPAVAVEWLTKAAEKDASYAQFALGNLYESGRGVQRDAAAAANWYRRAMTLRHAEAAWRLGLLYAAGQGVETDYVVAYRLIHNVVWHLPTEAMNMQARRTLDVLGNKLTAAQREQIEQPELDRLKRRLGRTPVRQYW
jgi:hypothetical protein